MSLTPEALYAALAEGVYQRSPKDIRIDYQPIIPGFGSAPFTAEQLNAARFVSKFDDTGMIYSARGTGFAAQVLKNDITGSYVVVFRGTDWGGSIDRRDVANDLSIGTGNLFDLTLGTGSSAGGQVVDTQRLLNLVLAVPTPMFILPWDASHQGNITLSGVQLTSFVAGQDFHLI